MNASEKEQLLADCVEEYHRRRALGESVEPEAWRERLGDHYAEFLEIVMASSAIDQVLDPRIAREEFPRPWGHYTLLSLVARGGMGSIYRAMDRKLGREVALKVLRAEYHGEPTAVERFRREARACAQITHDHVVPIWEYGVHEGRPFYAMPLLEGESLRDLVREGRAPEPEALARGLAGIADALSHLHEGEPEIIHRDLKPSNIMIDRSGRMVLTDFGLARSSEMVDLTQTGEAIGTPLYMGPEQVLGQREEIDERTDVYGLGATLYEALAGRPPFQPVEYAALYKMILSESPDPVGKVAPDAPEDLARIAMMALEKRKEDRYQTMAAMRDDLLAFAEGRPVTGRPVSGMKRAWRKNRRNFLLVASVLLAAAVAWWFLPLWNGRINIRANYRAEVTINDEEVGEAPKAVSVAPGYYEVILSWRGFELHRQAVTVDRWETETISQVFGVGAGDDEKLLQAASRVTRVVLPRFERPRFRNAGPGTPPDVRMLYPRGAVRLADLTEGRIEINDDFLDESAQVVVRREADGMVLFREDVKAIMDVEAFVFTEEMRNKLKPGDRATWSYVPEDGETVSCDFEVVADEVGDRLERIRGEVSDLPALVRLHLEAHLLLDEGLYTGALIVARGIAAEWSDSPRAWLVQLKSLERLGISDGVFREDLDNALSGTAREKRDLVIRKGN